MAALAVLVAASAAQAQAPARLRWQAGQVLVYRAEHTTYAAETVGDGKSETKSRLVVAKRWQVLAVDPAGVATLQFSLGSLLSEITRPDGEVLRFDSADPDKSTPALREQCKQYVCVPLAVLRVDGQGKVLEVKEARPGFGSPAKYENDPPFKVWLPAAALAPGAAWERPYQMTLEPPMGTGEKYAAVQRFTCKGVTGGLATLALTTEVKSPPAAVADQVPVWQNQPDGEIVFDLNAGRLKSAVLQINKEAKGQQGDNSSAVFRSTYKEEYVGDR
jgi:hypothetical protein